MLCLLNAASVLPLPTVLPGADLPNIGVESWDINEPALPNTGIQSEDTNGPVSVPDARAESESTDKPVLLVGAVGSEDEDEPVVVDIDDILEVAEMLVFRPSYKYWHNCVERRHKQAHREYAKWQ